MIKITHNILVSDNDIEFQYSRASGPGGQNVNKVETRVQLFFNIETSPLTDAVKQRLTQLCKNQINSAGQLVLSSQRFRSQERNRHATLKQLRHLIEQASIKPKQRKKTRVPKSVKEKRLADKRHRSLLKTSRKPPS